MGTLIFVCPTIIALRKDTGGSATPGASSNRRQGGTRNS